MKVVAITILNPNSITICNIYCIPNKEVRQDDLAEIVAHLQRPFLLLGDFNAKKQLWDQDFPTDRGRTTENLLRGKPGMPKGWIKNTTIFRSTWKQLLTCR